MKKILMLAAVAATLAACGEQIEAGHVGLRKHFGELELAALPPGFYWYSPIGGGVLEVDVRAKIWAGTDAAYTKDIQQGTFKWKMGLRPNPAFVPVLYNSVGAGWENRLVMDIVPDVLKNTIGQWEAAALVANRGKVSPQVLAAIKQRVSEKCKEVGLPPNTVDVISFSLTNIDFSNEFETAVEAKVTAVQKAEMEKNRTVQISEQAQQTIITAKADAESMRIRSQALSENQNLVQWEAVKKWNGVLPVQMLGEAPMPFLNLSK